MISLDTIVPSAYIYLIVCSRGPGSETFTAQIYTPIKSYFEGLKTSIESEYEDPAEAQEVYEECRDQYTKDTTEPEVENPIIDGLDNIFAKNNDEGPTFLVRKPLALREILRGICVKDAELYQTHNGGELSLAEKTATYRALINNWPPFKTRERWSSINAWRNLESERMPQWQVEQCMDLFDLTLEQCLTCDCDVLRESAKKPSKTYGGC